MSFPAGFIRQRQIESEYRRCSSLFICELADKRRVMKKQRPGMTFMMQQLEDSLCQRLPLRRPHSFSLSLSLTNRKSSCGSLQVIQIILLRLARRKLELWSSVLTGGTAKWKSRLRYDGWLHGPDKLACVFTADLLSDLQKSYLKSELMKHCVMRTCCSVGLFLLPCRSRLSPLAGGDLDAMHLVSRR